MICRWRISRVPCRTVANAQGRMRTAWQAEQPPFLLPFVRLWFPSVRMTERMRRTKPTIPMPEKRNGQHGNNPVESTKEAQDGTIGGVDDPDIGWRD